MFDRFVRLAQAKKALKDGRFEETLGLLEDPLVRQHRRAEGLRERALRGIVDRAERRAGSGAVREAIGDVEAVLQRSPEFDGAKTLLTSLQERDGADQARLDAARDLSRRARRHVEQGQLVEAETLLDAIETPNAEVESVQALLAARRKAAIQSLEQSDQELGRGDVEAARKALDAARGLDANVAGAEDRAARVAKAVATELAKRLADLLRRGAAAEALREYERQRARVPELAADPRLAKLVKDAASAAKRELIGALEQGDFDRLVSDLDKLDASERDAVLGALGTSMEEIREIVQQRNAGEFAAAAAALRELADGAGSKRMRGAAKQLEDRAADADGALERARALVAEGDLVAARAELVELLEEFPMHEHARREMELIDEGARDRSRRLTKARELSKDGKLREASALAMSLAVAGPQGEEARLLLRDLQARIDVVQRGVQQVLRDAHGRASGSRDGLQHCVRRLEELARMQSDEPELVRVTNALQAELDGLDALERANAGLESSNVEAIAVAVAEFAAARDRFLDHDRLESRFLELADAAAARVEADLAAGRLTAAEGMATAFGGHVGERPIRVRFEQLADEVQVRTRQVEKLVESGFVALEGRDVDRAEERLREARVAWIDGSTTKRLETALSTIRDCESRIVGVEALAENADVGAARAKLDEMGPTHGLFRTRIFDLKKNLARAQGLDGAFLLRVDEGGEFLVLRGETISIGNMRDGGADVPVLANLAGRHARIRRTMSFHGGMQDRIEADQGAVFVDGERQDRAPLRDGKSVRLGKSFDLGYRVPCKRSLTSMLTMRGFTVAGTDKILLLKDRGRDGRIVIGRGSDVHVRVPDAEGEIEIFASKDGQLRVRYDGGGSMDGRPFTGEEPITAGAVVSCGKVTFVLQPWSAKSGRPS